MSSRKSRHANSFVILVEAVLVAAFSQGAPEGVGKQRPHRLQAE